MAKPTSSPTINSGNSLGALLTHCWLIYEGSGTTVHDLAGTGTNNGTFGASAPAWGTDANGDPCLSFTVAGQVVNLAANLTLSSPWSVAFGVIQTNADNQGMVAGDSGGTSNFAAWLHSGSVTARANGNDAAWSTPPAATTYHNYCVAYDGTNAHLYVDGTEYDAGQTIPGAQAVLLNALGMGYSSTTFSLLGKLSYYYTFGGTTLSAAQASSLSSSPYQVVQSGAAPQDTPELYGRIPGGLSAARQAHQLLSM